MYTLLFLDGPVHTPSPHAFDASWRPDYRRIVLLGLLRYSVPRTCPRAAVYESHESSLPHESRITRRQSTRRTYYKRPLVLLYFSSSFHLYIQAGKIMYALLSPHVICFWHGGMALQFTDKLLAQRATHTSTWLSYACHAVPFHRANITDDRSHLCLFSR